VTEQLALQQGVGNRAAVDGDELVVAPGAVLVDQLGHDPLPRPRLAGEQHGGLGGRDGPHLAEDLFHHRAVGADKLQRILLPETVPQVLELVVDLQGLLQALLDVPQLVGVDGIGDVVAGALFHRHHRVADHRRLAHDDELRHRVSLPERLQHRLVIEVAVHRPAVPQQQEVDEDEFVPLLPLRVEAGFLVRVDFHLVFRPQALGDGLAGFRVGGDHQDGFHATLALPPSTVRPGGRRGCGGIRQVSCGGRVAGEQGRRPGRLKV